MVQNEDCKNTTKARHAAKIALAGKSPRQVGHEKTLKALKLIYRWGWSTPTMIDTYVNNGRRGLSARLLKSGLTKSERTEAFGGIKNMPMFIIKLTDAGVAEVEANISNLMPYEPFFFKNQLRHDLGIQELTLKHAKTGYAINYQTPRELAKQSEAGKKQPDAVWTVQHENGEDFLNIAIELELSAKRDRELDQTIFRILKAVNPNNKQHYDGFFIFSPSKAIIKRYEDALTPGKRLQTWKKNAARHWVEDKKIEIQPELVKKIIFFDFLDFQ
jgi:hypothetical protein